MLRILAFALALAVAGRLLLWVADRAWQPIAVSLRIGAVLVIAMIAAMGFALASSDQNFPIAAAIGGCAMLLLAATLFFRIGTRRSRSVRNAAVGVPATRARPSEEWRPFLASLGWGTRSRAAKAHDRIREFVVQADQHGLAPEHQSLLIALKRRVPELLAEWQRCHLGASADERQRYSLRTLSILEQLASEADQARASLRQDGDRKFESLERYFDGFTKKGDRAP